MKRIILLSSLFIMSIVISQSCAELKKVPLDNAEAVSGINDFGFDVFRRVAGDNPVMVSPVSLSMVLSMTAGGAGGETYGSMVGTLGMEGYSSAQLGAFYKALADSFKSVDIDAGIALANAIWVDEAINLKTGFVDASKTNYDAELSSGDFSSKAVINEINDWCSRNTEGKIDRIIDELGADMKMALLNALYFKADWNFEFREPVQDKFRCLDGSLADVSMLGVTDQFAYCEDETLQMLELPYGNGSFVMDVILPKEDTDFRSLAKTVDSEKWNALVAGLGYRRVAVRFPEFKMEFEADLTELLADMGMAPAFGVSADFSRISDTPLAIGIVKQKTYIDVNQKGTEAAAVSFVGMKLTSAGPGVNNISFVADHPFIFAIRECSTGALLFIGQKTR